MFAIDQTTYEPRPALESAGEAAKTASVVLRILELDCRNSGLAELAFFIGLAQQVADEDTQLYGSSLTRHDNVL